MYSLVNASDGDSSLEHHGRMTEITHTAFGDDVCAQYSSDLLDLIMKCVSYLPEDRDDFLALKRKIRNFTGYSTTDHARGLRDAPSSDKRFDEYALKLKRESWPKRHNIRSAWRYERSPPAPPARGGRNEDDNVINGEDSPRTKRRKRRREGRDPVTPPKEVVIDES